MIFRIDDRDGARRVRQFAEENGIAMEELDEGNFMDGCPMCGDYEFWHGGHCSHCGYDAP